MQSADIKATSERVTGVSNVAYDVMVVLSNQLQGVAALQDYKLDAQDDADVSAAFERIEQNYQDGIEELRGLLASRL